MGVIMKRGINYTGSEGIELTQAEYDALSTEEKNNGTTYFVTDSVHGGGGGSYVLPPATANTLGGVKVGTGLDVTADGTLSATGGGTGDANFELDEQYNMANVNNNVQYLSMDFNDSDTLGVAAYNPGTYMASRMLATKDYVDAHAGSTYTAGTGIDIDSNNVISVAGTTPGDVFIAVYGQTTSQEIYSAIRDGKQIWMKGYDRGAFPDQPLLWGVTRPALYARANGAGSSDRVQILAQYAQSANQLAHYAIQGSTWTETLYNMQYRLKAGYGTTISGATVDELAVSTVGDAIQVLEVSANTNKTLNPITSDANPEYIHVSLPSELRTDWEIAGVSTIYVTASDNTELKKLVVTHTTMSLETYSVNIFLAVSGTTPIGMKSYKVKLLIKKKRS